MFACKKRKNVSFSRMYVMRKCNFWWCNAMMKRRRGWVQCPLSGSVYKWRPTPFTELLPIQREQTTDPAEHSAHHRAQDRANQVTLQRTYRAHDRTSERILEHIAGHTQQVGPSSPFKEPTTCSRETLLPLWLLWPAHFRLGKRNLAEEEFCCKSPRKIIKKSFGVLF